MPKFHVTSGEHSGSNGVAPAQRTLNAKDFDDAAKNAPSFGRGKIKTVTPLDYDEDEHKADYMATTNRGTSFKVVVREIL